MQLAVVLRHSENVSEMAQGAVSLSQQCLCSILQPTSKPWGSQLAQAASPCQPLVKRRFPIAELTHQDRKESRINTQIN